MTTVAFGDGGDHAERRKARGAFFTPPEICRFIADWAVRGLGDRVLEPSCGDAAFLLAAGRKLAHLAPSLRHGARLSGVELHGDSARRARDRLAAAGFDATVENADFFTLEPRAHFDVVLGNPPYVRYQDFSGDARVRGLRAALQAGVALSGLVSSWAPFTVHAAQFLRVGGRLGMVLPAELMTVNYAAAVRRFLLERFSEVTLITFNERVFPGVMEEIVVVLADGFDCGHSGHLSVVQARNVADLDSPLTTKWTPLEPGDKWTPGLVSGNALATYQAVASGNAFATLDTWGDTTLGMVTGRNSYFALSESGVAAHRLEASDVVRVSPPGSRHLRDLELHADRWDELRRAGQPVYLFRPAGAPSTAAQRYIAAGEARGIHEAYKCRVRRPWWRVPDLRPADLLLTCMNAGSPQLCTNSARIHHLNSVHGVYLREHLSDRGRAVLPVAALNSMTLLGAETVGRAYGGGILKIEPKEADRLPVPSPEILDEAAGDLLGVRDTVAGYLRTNQLHDAVALVDDVLMVRRVGLSPVDVSVLRAALESLRARRRARGRAPREAVAAVRLEEAG